MTKSKNTKRALLMSVLSMLLCMAMLAGSTFAWFTDSVTSGKNKIVAGNLDVELYHTNGYVKAEEKVGADTMLFVDKDGKDGKAVQWEPGVMLYENFTVKNEGSLALKYKLTLNAVCNTVDEKSLKDVLKVAIIDGAFSGDRAVAQDLTFDKTVADFEKTGNLKADEAGKAGNTHAVVIYWEPSANDNEYNFNNDRKDYEKLYIELGVNLVATQDTVENDSFDENYDANATYENEVERFTFTNASDADAFCPRNPEHASHDVCPCLRVKDGVAEIPQNGAWFCSAQPDWDNYTYTLKYDVDLSKLNDGAFISFDAGEDATWETDLKIGFKKTGDKITAYNGLQLSDIKEANKLGEIGNKVTVTYTFSVDNGKFVFKQDVSDGERTYTTTNTNGYNSAAKIFWDVYVVDGVTDGACAALDNFVMEKYKK